MTGKRIFLTLSTRGCLFLKTIAVKCKSWLANLASDPKTNYDEEFVTDRSGSCVVAERATATDQSGVLCPCPNLTTRGPWSLTHAQPTEISRDIFPPVSQKSTRLCEPKGLTKVRHPTIGIHKTKTYPQAPSFCSVTRIVCISALVAACTCDTLARSPC